MNINVTFEESACNLRADFQQVTNVSDGGFERGYSAGYDAGESDGHAAGYAEGQREGYASGFAEGEAEGNALADSIVERSITEFSNHRITKIGQYAFARHSGLVKIDIPNVERIEAYGFNYCTGLTEIELPKCKYIAGQSFNSCGKLRKIVAPMCEEIGGHAITASALACLVLGGEKVCKLDNAAAIETTPMKNGTGFIYVPDNLVEQYKTAANWSTYASQIKPLSELE